ncbi:MAG: membrane protein insertion efficiency factor YidD [Candidatus Omnitrophica bacterium CG07_land_8_20_14_0_80_42_15]|uniref:Putative membrane protein insertion efficiency factor n=1 Tax=Candidatus Aquitaenariimonas noxiae TaxID=1974741 RepID=A0A2J0L3C9_9BACT|nr:MAG: membrane protein insertion efficiency factor YidD [Candidatus Omnitrophica bacterium CG07_land_8_20_14_0_80_42_15]
MKKGLILLIKLYQKSISATLPPHCRFHPTCSEYAINAIEKKGIIAGAFLIVWRLFRCNPYCSGGYDPVK